MNITSGIALYAVVWFVVLYMALPLFVKSQEEAGEVEPGTSPGAPDAPLMRKKLIWTTIIASMVWLALYVIITSGVITVADMEALTGRGS